MTPTANSACTLPSHTPLLKTGSPAGIAQRSPASRWAGEAGQRSALLWGAHAKLPRAGRAAHSTAALCSLSLLISVALPYPLHFSRFSL